MLIRRELFSFMAGQARVDIYTEVFLSSWQIPFFQSCQVDVLSILRAWDKAEPHWGASWDRLLFDASPITEGARDAE